MTEDAFRAVASLLDKYEEVVAAGKQDTISSKIAAAQEKFLQERPLFFWCQ